MELVDFDAEKVTSEFLHARLEKHFEKCQEDFEYIKDKFRQNHINGRVLISLTEDDLLQQLQIQSFGHRRLIVILVREFQLSWVPPNQFKISFDGVKSLLETLLLITALILSFAFSSLNGLDHDELVDADARYLNMLLRPSFRKTYSSAFMLFPEMENAYLRGDPVGMAWLGKEEWSLLSVHYFHSIMMANSILFSTLFAGSAMYISLILSDLKRNQQRFQLLLFFIPVLGGFVSFVVGTFYLIHSYSVIGNMVFPLYDLENVTTKFLSGTFRTVEMNINGGKSYFGLATDEYRLFLKISCGIIVAAVFIQHILLFELRRLQYFWRSISATVQAPSVRPDPIQSPSD
jgi:hypothetical protein